MSKQTSQVTEFEKALDEIIDKTMTMGQLLAIATKGWAKTTAVQHIIRRIRERQEHAEQKTKLIVFDTVLEWRHRFDEIPYVKHEDIRFLPLVQDLLVDIGYVDAQIRQSVIGEILLNDFRKKQELKEKHKGDIPFTDVYVIEEIQNCLGTHSMNGNVGRFWLTMVSECRNYKMVIIGLGQRFADISTKVVDRTRYYLIGGTSGERDLKKIAGIGGKALADKIKTLKKGEFIFWDKDSNRIKVIYFPEFKQKGKPYEYDMDKNSEEGYVKEIIL